MSVSLSPDAVSADLFDAPAFVALSGEQRMILRLYFRERWPLSRIAQYLRISLRTVKRHKADALAALQTTGRAVVEAVERQEGRVRFQITLRQRGAVKTRTDPTLSAAARLLI